MPFMLCEYFQLSYCNSVCSSRSCNMYVIKPLLYIYLYCALPVQIRICIYVYIYGYAHHTLACCICFTCILYCFQRIQEMLQLCFLDKPSCSSTKIFVWSLYTNHINPGCSFELLDDGTLVRILPLKINTNAVTSTIEKVQIWMIWLTT